MSKQRSPYLVYTPELVKCSICHKENDSRMSSDLANGGDCPKARPEHIGNGSVFFSRICVSCDSENRQRLRDEAALDNLDERRQYFRDGQGRGFKRAH